MHGDAADCWTFAPDGHELVCRAVRRAARVGGRPPDPGPRARSARRSRPAGPFSAATSRRPSSRRRRRTTPSSPRSMDAPILSFGEIRGVLGVCSREPDRFDESDLRLIEALREPRVGRASQRRGYEESTRQTQVERGFYRIAVGARASRCPPRRRSTRSRRLRRRRSAATSAAVLRSAGDELELAGAHSLDRGLAAYLRDGGRGPDRGRPRRQGARVAPARRRRPLRRGLARAAADAESRLAARDPARAAGECGSRARARLLPRARRCSTDEQLELAGHVAGAARGALERSELYERERRARSLAQQLARAGASSRASSTRTTCSTSAVRSAVELRRGRRRLGAPARGRRGRRARRRRGRGGARRSARARRRPPGWSATSSRRARTRAIADVRDDARIGEADPMLAAGYAGLPRRADDRARTGRCRASSPSTPAPARLARGGGRGAAGARGDAPPARAMNAELYQGVSHEQQRSEAILANVADGIVAVDREGKVVLWNPAAERITGVPQAEALGRTPAEALGRPLEAAEGVAGRQPARADPARRRGGLALAQRGGDDRSRRRRRRPDLRVPRHLRRARVEQMKSDFVSTVSHELRTPLTSIYGFAETLLRQDVQFGEEERATFLRYIASESERLTSIVDRLLSVAQLDTGDIAVQLAETDVGGGRERGRALDREPATARTATASSSRSRTSRSPRRPTATSSARCSRTCSTTRSATRRPAAPSPSPRAARPTRSRSASRTRASASRTPSRS